MCVLGVCLFLEVCVLLLGVYGAGWCGVWQGQRIPWVVDLGEAGYRDAMTNIINSTFKRGDDGKLTMHVDSPMLVEARIRTQSSGAGDYHEGDQFKHTHTDTYEYALANIDSSRTPPAFMLLEQYTCIVFRFSSTCTFNNTQRIAP